VKTSTNLTKISAALLKAQKTMTSAKKDASNPFFKSRYADLNSVIEACKDALNDNEITILQPHVHEAGANFVETTLLHSSGEYISSQTLIQVAKQNDPQALGSAISYARRYGLQSLVSLPAEDDDGEAAMSRTKAAPVSAWPQAQTITITTQGPTAQTAGLAAVMQNKAATVEVGTAKTPDAAPTKVRSFRKAGQPATNGHTEGDF
jgi:ERF superfamily